MMQPSPPKVSSGASEPAPAVVRYSLATFLDDWVIREEPVSEAVWHDRCLELFRDLLDAWVEAQRRDAAVFRDVAIRARRERPQVGWNPDVCVVEPAPPGARLLDSVRLWDHAPPRFSFEAVSPNHPNKDYSIVPDKCAVAGVFELVVFDPLLAGPRSHGGPWLLQVWRREEDQGFARVYAGDEPVRSEFLDAFLLPDRGARTLRVAASPTGDDLWLTREEQAVRREAEAVRREAEALKRVAELEARLRERQGR